MIKAIFFDFDETIFDHKHSAGKGLEELGKDYPALLSVPLEELETELWRLMDWNYGRVLKKEITPMEARVERIEGLFRYVEAEVPKHDLPRLAEIYSATYGEHSSFIEGVDELIGELRERGYYLGIITNGMTKTQRARLEQLGLDHYFDRMIASEEANSEKPNPEIFHYALDFADCRPEEALMIGDAWDKDIEGAIAVGMKAIWFKRRDHKMADVKRAGIAGSVAELRNILVAEGLL